MCQIPNRTVCFKLLTAVALNAVRKIARHSPLRKMGDRILHKDATGQDRHVGGDGREGGAANERRWPDRRLSASYIRSYSKKYPFRLYNQIIEMS